MGAYGCIVRNVTSNRAQGLGHQNVKVRFVLLLCTCCVSRCCIEIGELTTWHAMAVLLLCFKIEIGHLASPLQGCRASLLLPVLMLITMLIMMLVIIIGLIMVMIIMMIFKQMILSLILIKMTIIILIMTTKCLLDDLC